MSFARAVLRNGRVPHLSTVAWNELTTRAVVELVDMDGLSFQEAADALGVPVGTVMSRQHRARKRMRDSLVAAGVTAHGSRS